MLGLLAAIYAKYAFLYYSDWRKIEAGTHPITEIARAAPLPKA
jgi:hypothetical protein